MARRKSVNPETARGVAVNAMEVMPILQKQLLRMDVIQTEHSLPASHIQLLALLNSTPSITVSEISNRMGIAKPNITPLIDRLVERGYAERKQDTHDRRMVNVNLCPAGKEKIMQIQEDMVRQVTYFANNLSDKSFAEMDKALKVLIKVLNEARN